ncbi:MAG: GvpL/GvpF family gas vesicle protein [Chloroflexi bacterium]|nr:GvpL/GvpF family gas vesicle protein [Chloroflexota bacterium]
MNSDQRSAVSDQAPIASRQSPVANPQSPVSDLPDGDPVCVYAILPAAEIELPSIPGIDQTRPVYGLAGKAVQAVVSRVRADQFNQSALEAGLQDPAWIDVHVRAHQQVLDTLVATRQPVIPLRFCTIYRDEAAVRAVLTAHEPALVAELDRLRGRQEWGIKLFVAQEALQAAILTQHTEPGDLTFALLSVEGDDAALRALQTRIAGMSAGRAFLLQKKLDALVVQKADEITAGVVEESHAHLSGHAVAATSLALHPNPPGMELNAAYLVAERELDGFRAELARLGEEYGGAGVRYELSGPWPAYNFIELDLNGRGNDQ